MKIHREGIRIILFTILISLFLGWLFSSFITWEILLYLIYSGLTLLIIWTISFFRVPNRDIAYDEQSVLSAADGKVVAIEEVVEPEYFQEKVKLVSVFMSPFNVHVNWYSFSGEVVYTKYHQGRYLAAYNPKSSTDNERNTIVLRNQNGHQVLLRQIAGVMARRIICYSKVGDKVNQGDEFGIIRFGSRVDFFLPLDSDVKVNIGDKVKAQRTVIATFPES